MLKPQRPTQTAMRQRFSKALVAMETSKPEAHQWRLFEVFKPLPRPAGVALALWAAERALLVMEEETPNEARGEQATDAIRQWMWGRADAPEVYKQASVIDEMKHRYVAREATFHACEAIYFAATVAYAELYWTLISSTFTRSANANVAIRSGTSADSQRTAKIRTEEHALQREVTRGFLTVLLHDESALVLLDECSDGDEQARAVWMDRITELGLTT